MSELETRYRRLLAWYPADHQREHEQEMLGVLLAAARPGQTRPSRGDTWDLLRGAVRIRTRRAVQGGRPHGWAAATAIAGFLATLLQVAEAARYAVNTPGVVSRFLEERAEYPGPLWSRPVVLSLCHAPYWAAWVVVALLAWRGARRPAAVAAAALTGVQLVLAAYGGVTAALSDVTTSSAMATTSLPLALLVSASLLTSPGPRYGARLLGRRAVAGAAVMAAVLVPLTTSPLFDALVPRPHGGVPAMGTLMRSFHRWQTLQLGALLLAAVLLLAVLARAREGRRAAALLAVPATPLIALKAGNLLGATSGILDLTGLVVGGLGGFALAMVCVRLAEIGHGRRVDDARPEASADR